MLLLDARSPSVRENLVFVEASFAASIPAYLGYEDCIAVHRNRYFISYDTTSCLFSSFLGPRFVYLRQTRQAHTIDRIRNHGGVLHCEYARPHKTIHRYLGMGRCIEPAGGIPSIGHDGWSMNDAMRGKALISRLPWRWVSGRFTRSARSAHCWCPEGFARPTG